MALSSIDRSLGGQLLNGVKDCYIIANEFEQNPRVIMLIGETHGKQTCGDSDYVSAYKTFLQYNEATAKVPIDVLIEATNDNVVFDRPNINWIYELRNAFQDCYVFSSRDTGKCVFRHARFHWTDPSHDVPTWLLDVEALPVYMEDKSEYEHLSHKIKSEDDLQKIIFENPYIIKQGERCKIDGWRRFIHEQYNILYNQWKTEFDTEYPPLQGEYWWKCGMYDTQRFSMDVYAFLRMFRKKEKQHSRWTTANRFENIIFHAGARHVNSIKQLLLNLNTENARFRVVNETHADDADKHEACCRVDFMHFLKTIQDKTPGHSARQEVGPTPPLFLPGPSTFIRRQRPAPRQGGGGSKRVKRKTKRVKRKTKRVKRKTRRHLTIQ